MHACYDHSDNRDTFGGHSVDGRTLQIALRAWWRADGDAPAAAHTHVACLPPLLPGANRSSAAEACARAGGGRPGRCAKATAAPSRKAVKEKQAAVVAIEAALRSAVT